MIEEFDQRLLSTLNRLNSYLPFPDDVSIRNSINGGHTQSRTGMTLQSADFKSAASTNSAIRPCIRLNGI